MCLRILAVILILYAGCKPVHAHWADLSAAEVQCEGSSVKMRLTVPEILLPKGDLQDTLSKAIQIADEEGRQARITDIQPTDDDPVVPSHLSQPMGRSHRTLRIAMEFPAQPRELHIRFNLFLFDSPTAHCMMRVTFKGQPTSLVFTPENTEQAIGAQPLLAMMGGFLWLGLEHIFTGIDHVLFIICLLMLGGTLRDLLKIVTAFTVAHSVTLSLAVLGIVTMDPRMVEAIVALSIVYVAVENIVRQKSDHRWRVTFCFGLVHGLGFAGILQEMSIPRPNLAPALISFNVGVELGQLAIVACAWPLLTWLRRLEWEPRLRRAVNGIVACVALVWFAQRVFGE